MSDVRENWIDRTGQDAFQVLRRADRVPVAVITGTNGDHPDLIIRQFIRNVLGRNPGPKDHEEYELVRLPCQVYSWGNWPQFF